jgi:hypothetical protein
MAKKAAKKSEKTTAKKRIRVEYTKADVRELRDHSKARTPVRKIAKEMKRSEGSLRQKAGSWYWARPSPLDGRYNRPNEAAALLWAVKRFCRFGVTASFLICINADPRIGATVTIIKLPTLETENKNKLRRPP